MSMAAKSIASLGGQTPFLYLAARPDGGRKIGVRRAADRQHLAQQLRRERLVPLRNWSLPALGGVGGKIGLKDQAEINTQLAQLLSRGVPLVEALEVTASAVSARVRGRVEKMREMVSAGSSFSEACRAVGSIHPVTVAVYRAAERTGDLAGAAKQLAGTMRRQLAISEKAVTLLVYPSFVLSISVVVSLLVITLVVPNIGKSLKSAGVPIPGYTRAVIAVGEALRDHALLASLAVLVLAGAAVVGRKAIAALFSRVVRRVPIIKGVMAAQEAARFFTVMSAMTRSGVTLAEGLGTATGAIGDPDLKRELTRLRTRLIEGGVLRFLIEDVSSLPIATRRLLIAGERSGDLQTVFDNLSADLSEEVDRRSTRLLSAMEPLLIVLMFLMIGSLLLSVMIPLLGISSRVL